MHYPVIAANSLPRLQVKVDDEIWREGRDLYSKVFVPYTHCILGGSTMVSTVCGPVPLSIPPGMQAATLLVLLHLGLLLFGALSWQV